MLEVRKDTEPTMSIVGASVPGIWRRTAPSTGLPKCVRPLDGGWTQDAPTVQFAGQMVEFEVVTGNAAYREGERFYLTAAQAKYAYSFDRQAS
jgi:hypothetical protein